MPFFKWWGKWKEKKEVVGKDINTVLTAEAEEKEKDQQLLHARLEQARADRAAAKQRHEEKAERQYKETDAKLSTMSDDELQCKSEDIKGYLMLADAYASSWELKEDVIVNLEIDRRVASRAIYVKDAPSLSNQELLCIIETPETENHDPELVMMKEAAMQEAMKRAAVITLRMSLQPTPNQGEEPCGSPT